MAIYVRDTNGVLQALDIPAYKGEKGEAGITPNLQVGDVVTLESGQQATIVRRGDDENPIFDFAIPKGDDGKDGIFVGRVDDAPDHAQVVVNDDASPYDLFFENANVSYMGDTYTSLKEKADADIEYLLREIQTQHYEGSNITATDTYQKQVKSAILKGVTKYRDKYTGEILEAFEEGRNLELVSVRVPVLTTMGVNIFEGETERGYINPSTGQNSSAWNDLRSVGYTEVIGGNTIRILVTNGNWMIPGIYEYDENKNFIGKVGNNILSPHAKFVRFSIGGNTDVGGTSQVMLYYGDDIKREYEPHKTNILSTPEDIELGSVGDVKDELDLVTGELAQRTDIRPYKEGDESNSEVLTDMTNTRYKLPKEVIKTVDLSGQKVYSYDGTTHYTTSSGVEGHLAPILSIDIPTNLPALVSRQRDTIKDLEKENEALKEEVAVVDQQRESGDLELLSSDFDLDFRLMEIEFALDIPIAATFKEVRNMARTPYEMAKILILGGKYERSDMEYKLGKYLERKQITQAQYDELIALMEANELVV